MTTREFSTGIDRITTQPSIESIDTHPTVRKIKLPDPSSTRKAPMIYVPVAIHIDKPGGIALGIGIFLVLASCTIGNIAMMFMHQIIVIR